MDLSRVSHAEQIRHHAPKTLVTQSHKSLDEWLGHIMGQISALEFSLPILEKENARLRANSLTGGENYSILRQEHHRLQSDLFALRHELLDADCFLASLRVQFEEEVPPSEEEISTEEQKLIPLYEKIACLKDSLCDVSSDHWRGQKFSECKELLVKLVSELRVLEDRQTKICDLKMDMLTLALDQEESMLREVRADTDALDRLNQLEKQQGLLVGIHASLKEANEVRNCFSIQLAKNEAKLAKFS